MPTVLQHHKTLASVHTSALLKQLRHNDWVLIKWGMPQRIYDECLGLILFWKEGRSFQRNIALLLHIGVSLGFASRWGPCCITTSRHDMLWQLKTRHAMAAMLYRTDMLCSTAPTCYALLHPPGLRAPRYPGLLSRFLLTEKAQGCSSQAKAQGCSPKAWKILSIRSSEWVLLKSLLLLPPTTWTAWAFLAACTLLPGVMCAPFKGVYDLMVNKPPPIVRSSCQTTPPLLPT